MSEHEQFSAAAEARRSTPGKAWTPEEPHRQDMLLRYLGAVADISAARAREPERPAPSETVAVPDEPGPAPVPRVRDVMDTPAVSVPGDRPFVELARTLAHEHVGAVPVVDAKGHVIGVVSESDLLAKAAVEAMEHPSGPVGRLRDRGLREKARGVTAATLMTAPVTTVRPGTTVADAALIAARRRLKRMPVVDWKGRLVGVVRRAALLAALVRDDGRIREEITSRIIADELHLPQGSVGVTVRNGVVDLTGRLDRETVARLVAEVRRIDDVTDVLDHLTAA
ncbi:CBS domain-containing protein [Streptomyces sp. FH025]|uniref:CBS domain-containing protein n=1 Tax=Streptomyces sp. FH025 TaxID=2815937 RepID=UPI001A9E6408|nr:CBS domain-containing protein [Streptomyces sp. FH025]MBO1414571.1 CBS domain-containing protein [Streptomyces sp. FH025]